jgi:hypothetical protein
VQVQLRLLKAATERILFLVQSRQLAVAVVAVAQEAQVRRVQMVDQAVVVVMTRNQVGQAILHQPHHPKVITVVQVQRNRNRMAVAVAVELLQLVQMA